MYKLFDSAEDQQEALKMLNEQLAGLTAKRKELAEKKHLFIKAQGVDEQAKKARQDAEATAGKLRESKATLAGLITKKTHAIQTTTSAITTELNALLPSGSAVFEIDDDGKCLIAWKNEKGNVVAYPGLSGGEKVMFDAALCHALRANVIIMEAAELDKERLLSSIEMYGHTDVQIIASSCHIPEGKTVGDGWEVVRV